MNKLKKMLCVVVALFAAVTSYAATAADYTDIVYAKDVKASLGGTVEVPIYLKNASYAVKSLQFSMELPEGISFVEEESVGHKFTKNALTNNWTISFRTKDGEAANTGLAMMSYQNDAVTTIATGDVEVFKIHLQVAANISAGTKNIIMKGITLTAGDGSENTILSGDATITSNVNIQRAEIAEKQDDDYAFSIAPFTTEAGRTYTSGSDNSIAVPILLKNKDYISSASFNLILPDGFGIATYKSGVITKTKKPEIDNSRSVLIDSGESTSGLSFNQTKDGEVVTYTLNSSDDLVLSNGSGRIATVYLTTSAEINPGTYNFKIDNISITSTPDGETTYPHNGGEYIFTVTVGAPTDKDPIIYGNITDASTVTAAIPAAATSVDISQATATDAVVDVIVEDAQAKNANAIVYAPSTYSGSKDNVVKEDSNGALVCSNLVIADNVAALNIPASFTAATASYTRTMDNTWGTICLPYAVASDANAAYYQVTGIESGALTLSKYDELPAGTPALVKKLAGSEIAPQATSVAVSGDLNNVSGTVTMHGSYANGTRVENANAYYIKDNMFYRCNGHFICNAFRAYFVADGANARELSIMDEDGAATAIEALTNPDAEVKVEGIYDVNGIMRSDLENGINIVKLSNGKIQKIIIK